MSAVILDCTAVAEAVIARCRAEVAALKREGVTPRLAMLRVGEKGADLSYERGAARLIHAVGAETQICVLDAEADQEEYIRSLRALNADPSIHGILPFRPLDHIDENRAIEAALSPEKDVDACTAANMGKVVTGDPTGLLPCTPAAIMELLEYYAEAVRKIRGTKDPSFDPEAAGDVCAGLKVCIINKSNVIGKPLAMMLTNRYATVSIVHRMMPQAERVRTATEADVVIAGMPSRGMVTADLVRPGALVIDASVIREKVFDENGEPVMNPETGRQKIGVYGCCAPEVTERAGYITPVPGLGAVTSAMLAANLAKACRLQAGTE